MSSHRVYDEDKEWEYLRANSQSDGLIFEADDDDNRHELLVSLAGLIEYARGGRCLSMFQYTNQRLRSQKSTDQMVRSQLPTSLFRILASKMLGSTTLERTLN